MPILGTIASSLRKAFTDTFNRTTSGSLGTSSGGGLWSAIRGVWFANGSQGQSNDSASTYPIAGYNMSTANVTVNLDIPGTSASAGGTGIAFWVTDSNNWWGVFPYVTTVSNCNTYGYSYSCSAYAYTTAYACTAYSVYGSVATFDGGVTYAQWLTGTYCSGTTYAYQGTYCSGTYSQITVCSTYVAAAGDIQPSLIKSVAGTVSSVLSTVAGYVVPKSLKVVTSGSGITISQYPSAAQTGTAYSYSTTQTAGGTTHGIILAPGGFGQTTVVDNIEIKL